ncbi:MAG: glycoside hydrolase family 2 protein, partial [Acidimicrobiales bacterium]
MREVRPLDDGWWFASGDIGIDAAIGGGVPFEPVTLPHTWNPPSPDGEPTEAEEVGWYRRDLSVDDAGDGRRVVVEFGAVARVADLYVGTTRVGQHEGGYSIFRVDVTDALDATGAGALSVRVDNETGDIVYPLLGDHTFFGGITRSVKLITCDPVHIDLADHGSPGVFLSQRELDDARGIVAARVRVANNGKAAANPTVRVEAFDADGASVATASAGTSVGPGEVTETEMTLTINSPRRWDGRDDPHLYRLVTELDDGADRVELPFGLRSFHADPDQGSFLNGRPYRLHGVSRHYDVGQRGAAMTRADNDHDLELLNELGVTAVRLSHYQHDQYMYDLCDRAGIAVWAEIPYNALTSGVDPAGNALSQMTELIRQSAHHPSIVCWGVQNEITLGQASNDPRPVIRELHQLVHDEDPTRPSAQANMPQAGFDDDIHTLTDLDALNTYCGWYYGEAAEVGAVLDEHHEANPDRP